MPNSRRRSTRVAPKKPPVKPRAKPKRPKPLSARTADRYTLYEAAVQAPEVEIAFIDRIHKKRYGRVATVLREDFCGTAWMACEWVKKREQNRAIGLDLDPVPLAWGERKHVSTLSDEQRLRLTLLKQNVLTPPAEKVEVIAALNFSYWIFSERAVLKRYFEACRQTLRQGGFLVMDLMGGSDCHLEVTDRTRHPGFTYVWEHASFDPVTALTTCKIHFEFRDKTRLKDAFVYHWRLWGIAELRDLLHEAGFGTVRIYWEGEDAKGHGNGVFREARTGEADRSYVAYIVGEA